MTEVARSELMNRLPDLLGRVAVGESIAIIEHGRPVAMLIPPPPQSTSEVKEIVEEMLAYRDRQGPTLGDDLTIRELIEEGRR